MKKRNYQIIALLTMICVMLTMSFATVGFAAESEAQEAADRLNAALSEVKGGTSDSENNENDTAAEVNIKLVKPSTKIRALPDDTLNFESPTDSSVLRKCMVSAETLQTLAERAYEAGKSEFYINAAYSAREIFETSVEIKTGFYPLGCSMGILTNDGYLHISAQATLSLFDENKYSKITIETRKQSEKKYRISLYGYGTDGNNGRITDIAAGDITFTVWPKDSFYGKTLQCSVTGSSDANANFSTLCTANDDGTISFDTVGTGTYHIGIYEDPYAQAQVEHTLEVVNDEYGFADLVASNRYEAHANSGAYLQDVFVNGISKGAITTIDVSEGDEVFVIFAKQGETVDTTAYDANAYANAKLEKTKKGIKATTIKVSTVSGVKKGVRIKWKKSAGYKLGYYEIYRSAKKAGGYKKIYTTKSGTATAYTDKKATKGKRYYYKVRGVRVIENQKVYTKWSNSCYRKAA